MNRPGKLLVVVIVLLACLTMYSALQAQQAGDDDDFDAATSGGKATFTSTCSGCHGLDGRGSERAPSLIVNAKLQSLSDEQIVEIVRNGVSGTGMPAFRFLPAEQVREVVRYVRLLQGDQGQQKLPGNAARGKAVFFGKSKCAACHTVAGHGGFLGPDLSSYAAGKAVKEVSEAIVNSERIAPPGYEPAVIVTGDGKRIEGVVRNEDNFSVQLQTEDGSFYSFDRSQLKDIHYTGESLMPSDYGKKLSPAELNDLVSYLIASAPRHLAQTAGNRGAKR